MKSRNFDLSRICCIYFNSANTSLVANPRNLFMCYLRFGGSVIKRIFRDGWRIKKCKSILFIQPTLNNKKTLYPIIKEFQNDDITVVQNFLSFLPWYKVVWHSLFYLNRFQRFYSSCEKEYKKVIRTNFNNFVTAYGTYVEVEHFFRKNAGLKVIVFANDHVMVNRCLIEQAIKYKVCTIYTQHASVTESFPPLSFSYSFLDGAESFEKYKHAGAILGEIILSGSSRFDYLNTKTKDVGTETIGIALNKLDDVEKVFEMCKFLSKHIRNAIVVRPHPAIEFSSIWHRFEKCGYKISHPSQEGAFEFASKVKLVIANMSSVHLDCFLMRTPTLMYNFSDNQVSDAYEYLKNGLTTLCLSKEEVLRRIRDGVKMDDSKLRFYNAAFGTPYEGRVGVLIADFIKSRLKASEIDFLNSVFVKDTNGCFIYK